MTHDELLAQADVFEKDQNKSEASRRLVRLLAMAVRELTSEIEDLEAQLADTEFEGK